MSTNPKMFIKRLVKKLNDKDLIIEQQKSFIQQQDKMLELAIEELTKHSCPNFSERRFDEPCDLFPNEVCGCFTCWRKYLQSEVSK